MGEDAGAAVHAALGLVYRYLPQRCSLRAIFPRLHNTSTAETAAHHNPSGVAGPRDMIMAAGLGGAAGTRQSTSGDQVVGNLDGWRLQRYARSGGVRRLVRTPL